MKQADWVRRATDAVYAELFDTFGMSSIGYVLVILFEIARTDAPTYGEANTHLRSRGFLEIGSRQRESLFEDKFKRRKTGVMGWNKSQFMESGCVCLQLTRRRLLLLSESHASKDYVNLTLKE